MKNICFAILFLLPILFLSCNKDTVTNPSSSTVTKFSFNGTNDTLSIEFEVSGTHVSTVYKYYAGVFSSNTFYVKSFIESISSGSIGINVYNSNDTLPFYNKIYSSPTNGLDTSSCTPALNYMGVSPINFSGKGKFWVYKR